MESIEKVLPSGVLTQKTQILQNSGLNWKVVAEPLQTASGLKTDSIAVVRQDTKTILGVHKDGYHLVQNSEVLDLILGLANTTQTTLHKGGEMKGGEFIYYQLKTNDMNLNGDKIKGYATGINSHNGKISLGLGHSNLTISCMNTLYRAYGSLEFKIKHTKNMQSKIELLAKQFEVVLSEE